MILIVFAFEDVQFILRLIYAEMAFKPQSFFDENAAILPEPPPDGKVIRESFEWMEKQRQYNPHPEFPP